MAKEVKTPEQEEVEEVNPVEMIEMLSEDLTTALTALKKVAQMKPHMKLGGPGNKSFGRRFQQCFVEAQLLARDALLTIHGGTHEEHKH